MDDEAGMRMAIARTLARYKLKMQDVDDEVGFDVLLAESAEQALELIESEKPELMLLDYKLPGMSGLELLDRLNEEDSAILTVMITAYASLETAVSAIKRGAFDFLAKPFTPDELRATVQKASQNIILARQVKKLAEEKRRIRFEFISVLGHELKAPLNAIDGYLHMFRDRAAGEEVTNYDKMVDRSMARIEQMRKLIADLLEMTKIESGQRQRRIERIDLTEIANSSIETMIPDAELRNISINFEADEDSTMLADRQEVEIIFNNLISNSIKYNRDNGSVRIAISKDDAVRITVADTGIGMTKEECERLFNDFVRIKNEKTRHIEGSGLGLSTVRKIARMYDGDVEVASRPDHGSTFTVTLVEPEPPEEDD
ncbi:MAG: sensor histidine kinase [Bacteroidota bacterium]